MARTTPHAAAEKAAQPRIARWLRFGPGLFLALVATAVLWPRTQGEGPKLDRRAGATLPAPAPAPDLEWLLRKRDDLNLRPDQVAALDRLRNQQALETRTDREALDQASTEFNRQMMGDREKGLPLPQLQDRTAAVSQLSRRLAEGRHLYWTRAGRVLTAEQRQRAEEKWTQQWTRVAPPRPGP